MDEKGNEWVIYEIYPGLYEERNAFNQIADRLDEIAELGVNVIWLMPIYEQGIEKGIGSPYSVKDYKKVNANYGTLEELKSLVAQAQAKDMKVILDCGQPLIVGQRVDRKHGLVYPRCPRKYCFSTGNELARCGRP